MQDRHKDYKKLVEPHRDEILGFSLSLTKNEDDAKDLTQVTMMNAFRFLHKFEDGNIIGWLRTICKNEFINFYRKKSKTPPSVDYTSISTPNPPITENGYDFDDKIIYMLGSINESYKQAVILKYVHGYKYQEIADIQNVKENTVRSRLRNARHQMIRTAEVLTIFKQL